MAKGLGTRSLPGASASCPPMLLAMAAYVIKQSLLNRIISQITILSISPIPFLLGVLITRGSQQRGEEHRVSDQRPLLAQSLCRLLGRTKWEGASVSEKVWLGV